MQKLPIAETHMLDNGQWPPLGACYQDQNASGMADAAAPGPCSRNRGGRWHPTTSALPDVPARLDKARRSWVRKCDRSASVNLLLARKSSPIGADLASGAREPPRSPSMICPGTARRRTTACSAPCGSLRTVTTSPPSFAGALGSSQLPGGHRCRPYGSQITQLTITVANLSRMKNTQ